MSVTPIIHRQVGTQEPDWYEERFARNGWTGAWRNGVFDWHHFHTTTHEVLGCYQGNAKVQLGGPDGPVHDLSAGDVVIIPAGCAHKRISASDDFAVVGAYPGGARPDMQDGPGISCPLRVWNRDPVTG